jgi:group II intron reverse transcriptase/maturase
MIKLFETKSKGVPITKEMVWEAYKKVKSNKGSAGVDKENMAEYEAKRSSNLYKLWNRLASGSYFPQPVREVMIPKANGGQRKLGIPTINDRIAQEVVKAFIEPRLEKVFVNNSYGYRPNKGAHQAVEAVRNNVYKYAWVVDMDIKSFFDEVSHELLTKALEVHVPEKWVKMYIKRWLETPSQNADGTLTHKDGKGTPQGGVISPLLTNLFLHYVLDVWLKKKFPNVTMVRYADDAIIHCHTEREVQEVLEAVRKRMEECKLQLNEKKTQIVYCKSAKWNLKNNYPKKFDFLGFTFKPTLFPNKRRGAFLGTGCAISQKAQTRIVEGWRKMKFHWHSTETIQSIANQINSKMSGIIRYYGKINLYSLYRLMKRFNYRLCKWVLNKYKRFKGSFTRGYLWIRKIRKDYPTLFYHWTVFKTI